MKLKKEEHIDRIIFLKLFTFEILKNIHKRSEKKKNIEKERVKQRISHILSKNHNKENEDNITKFIKKNYPIQRKSNNLSIIDKGEDKTKLKKIKVNKPPEKIEVRPGRSIGSWTNHSIIEKNLPREYHILEKQNVRNKNDQKQIPNKSAPQEMIDMSGMNKINDLFRDKTILSIECRGPGKDLLIKRYNQINIVKVMLSPSEINGVIDYFSRRSRIPVVDGILKVAVDDMIIAAVTSDLVGSKFIINKNSPYTILAK